MSSLQNCRIMSSQTIQDARGNLGVIECGRHIPFDIKRVYYLYNVPGQAERGAHGHRKLQQFILPIAGSFDVTLDDGFSRQTFHLNNPAQGLYVASGMWRDLANFSTNAVCLVLASELYDEADYYRNYDEFLSDMRLQKAA